MPGCQSNMFAGILSASISGAALLSIIAALSAPAAALGDDDLSVEGGVTVVAQAADG